MSDGVVWGGQPGFDEMPGVNAPAWQPGAGTPFLARLNADERQAIIAVSCPDHYPAGSVICREGDPARALYIIETGQVAVLKEVEEGRPILLGYRGPGELLGEMSLVSEHPRSASLIAMADTTLQRIDASHFPRLVECYPRINHAILTVLNDRLQEADAARTSITKEEQNLAHRLEMITGEAERLAEMARVRKDTVELLVHDLRTPLAVIDGCLEMLRSSLPVDVLASVDEVLGLAERSCERLGSLAEELLGSARGEGRVDSLARRPFDISRLLESAIEEANPQARRYGLEIVAHVPADLPRLRGDRAQLQRVLDNLLSNALSYTPAGGTIDVAASQQGDQIVISVTDTGPGVPGEHREAIFERFTRVPGLQGKRQGFGLGLYFCHQVIQAHAGQIWVEPGPHNRGSRFVIALPLDPESSPVQSHALEQTAQL